MTRDLFGNCGCGNPIGAPGRDICFACYEEQQERGSYTKLIGLRVKVDRPVDRERPCCRNVCRIGPSKGPHAGELTCADCGQHRGWLSKPTAKWIKAVVAKFGAPTTPIVVRNQKEAQHD
jgi:hypothetical protein